MTNFEISKDDLLQDKYITNWLEHYSSNTRLTPFNQFCEYLELTPSEIMEIHLQDLRVKTDDPTAFQNEMKKNLLDFFYYLNGKIDKQRKKNRKQNDSPISHNSARTYTFGYTASFFKKNNVAISFDRGEVPSESVNQVNEKTWKNGKDRIKKEDKKECIKMIRDALEGTRERAILLIKISTGLDDADVFNLKIKDFRDNFVNEYGISYIQGDRQRTGMPYQNCLSSEACEMIELYLKERKARGESLDDNDWLFVSKKKNQDGGYNKIKSTSFSVSIKTATEVLKLDNITPKSFRRWYESVLTKNDIDFSIRQRLLGRKAPVSTAYQEMVKNALKGEIIGFVEWWYEEIEDLILLGNGTKENIKLKKRINQMENKMKELKEIATSNSKVVLELRKNVKKLLEKQDK